MLLSVEAQQGGGNCRRSLAIVAVLSQCLQSVSVGRGKQNDIY